MNNLPFGSAEYRQFETTFLASVIVGMHFPPVLEVASHKEAWRKFSWELFTIKPVDCIFERPIFINRKDNKLGYIFDNGRAQVHISGDGYQNFADSVIPHAYKLKQFVTDVAELTAPTRLSIRKIDMFQIETANVGSVDEDVVRKHFFSDHYCDYQDNLAELDEEEKKMLGMKKNQWIENSHRLTIRSVFVKLKETDNLFRLILDIEEIISPYDGIDLGKLDETLKAMNLDLFNAFIWCVSENVINIMKNGKE